MAMLSAQCGRPALPAGAANPPAGMVPVRLRTPSGKTAIFYANPNATGQAAGSMRLPAPIEYTSQNAEASSAAGVPSFPPAGSEYMAQGETALHAHTPIGSQEVSHQIARPACAEAASFSEAVQDCKQPGVAEAGIRNFQVGDMVYRNGELASVVHVDSTLEPASYVIRLANSEQEVSCEGEHLVPAQVSDDTQASGLVQPQSFADAVQMQHLHAASSSAVPYEQQQYVQSQQYYFMPYGAEAHNQLLEQIRQLYHANGHNLSPEQLQQQLQEVYQANGLAGMQGGGMQMQDMAAMQAQQCIPQMADPYEMMHSLPAHEDREENHALKAVADALDRAEVNMLTGGRLHCSPPPGFDLDGNDAFSQRGFDRVGRGASSNFALKAAADTLGAVDHGSSLAGRLGASPRCLLDDPLSDDFGGSSSTNAALKQAADALEAMDRGSTLASRLAGSTPPRSLFDDRKDDSFASGAHNSALKQASDALNAIDAESSLASRLGSRAPPKSLFDDLDNGIAADLNSSCFVPKKLTDSLGAPGESSSLALHLGSSNRGSAADLAADHFASMASMFEARGMPSSSSAAPGVNSTVGQPSCGPASELMDVQLEDELTAAAFARSISPQMPSTCSDQIPLGGEASAFARKEHISSGAALNMGALDDDDDELELMAKMEIEQDDAVDFYTRPLPPKYPKPEEKATSLPPAGLYVKPPMQPPLPGRTAQSDRPRANSKSSAAPSPLAPRGPAPAHGSKSISKARNKFQDRDALVNLVLSEETPSRATTPRGSRVNDGRSTPRGSSLRSNSNSKPVTALSRRSQSHDIHFDTSGRHTPPSGTKATPRQISSLDSMGSGKAMPFMLDILNIPDGSRTPRTAKNNALDSPRRSEASSASSLPHLSEKRSHGQKPVTVPTASKSARRWKDNAAGVYA